MNIKWQEPRGYDKKDMLYPDRKMLKYRGMLLSDHTERIKEDEKRNSFEPTPFEQEEAVEEISFG